MPNQSDETKPAKNNFIKSLRFIVSLGPKNPKVQKQQVAPTILKKVKLTDDIPASITSFPIGAIPPQNNSAKIRAVKALHLTAIASFILNTQLYNAILNKLVNLIVN